MINLFLLPYGTDAVAAMMGIALKVIMIAVLAFVRSRFRRAAADRLKLGARDLPTTARHSAFFLYLFLSLFALVMTVVLSLSDRLLMGFFIEDATIITLGAGVLPGSAAEPGVRSRRDGHDLHLPSAGKAVGAFVLSIAGRV